MTQLAAKNADRMATQSQGVVERFRQEIAGQEQRVLPEVFHRESEVLEASVTRYERIIASASDNKDEWEKLRGRMSEDSVIAPYLITADDHPRDALNLARADVEYWKCLNRSGWKTAAQRKRVLAWRLGKMVILPLVIVIATAFLGNLVAASIQDRAFQKQKFFDAKFQRLREGQQRSVALVARLRSLKDLMAGWERFGGGVSPRQMLGEYPEELEQIRALGVDDKGGGQVATVAQQAQRKLDLYISCLEDKVGQPRNDLSESSCSEGFDLKVFEAITLSFVREISSLAD